MKHHGKSSKLKYEHAIIEGLRPLLESIAPWEDIHSIDRESIDSFMESHAGA